MEMADKAAMAEVDRAATILAEADGAVTALAGRAAMEETDPAASTDGTATADQ